VSMLFVSISFLSLRNLHKKPIVSEVRMVEI
jgi:hypothetical protein